MIGIMCLFSLMFFSAETQNSAGLVPPNPEIQADFTLEEKVGQLMMIGFEGTLPTEELRDQIQKMHIGSTILFPRNIENPKQVLILTKSIQALNKSQLPILIATDEEGGRVIRFYNDDVTMPGQMAIGATGSAKFAYEAGRSIAARLSTLGIDVNFAPVLDLNIESENRVVGSRSFGADPEIVSSLGSSYIRGVQSVGISAAAKHFPGHGRTKLDSHNTLPKIYSSLEKDLIPFNEAISQNVDMIMTAHVAYPKIDKNGMPATISPEIISNILRKKMKYDGVVITDDLEMGAIEQTYGIGETAVRAIVAGSDIVIIGWRKEKQREVYDALLGATKSGRISRQRLDEAVARIARLKAKRKANIQNEELKTEINIIINDGTQKKLAESITDESATLLKNDNDIIPLIGRENNILVVSPLYELYREIRKRYKNVYFVEVPLRPTNEEKKRLLKYINEASRKVDKIVVGIFNKHHAEIVTRLNKDIKIPIIVVSFDSPHYISKFPDVDAFLCVYHYRTGAAQTAARLLLGEITTKGTLPISLSAVSPKEVE
ncbi:MAG: hypothetical protein A3F16_05005 [Deltaproteobacteria bacterium RIFCSPHIGHO2_12_FULL_43_9]|nr:MAG: hypothetical protein A3F16_05005 [Deltaproteobacteria bacterium RIFCSPHIGHO2_12_FULL_43_9]